jgi:hypothetical protein
MHPVAALGEALGRRHGTGVRVPPPPPQPQVIDLRLFLSGPRSSRARSAFGRSPPPKQARVDLLEATGEGVELVRVEETAGKLTLQAKTLRSCSRRRGDAAAVGAGRRGVIDPGPGRRVRYVRLCGSARGPGSAFHVGGVHDLVQTGGSGGDGGEEGPAQRLDTVAEPDQPRATIAVRIGTAVRPGVSGLAEARDATVACRPRAGRPCTWCLHWGGMQPVGIRCCERSHRWPRSA